MKILISACASDNGRSGIGQYMKAILRELSIAEETSMQWIVYCESGSKQYLDGKDTRMTFREVHPFWTHPLTNLIWHFLLLPFLALWEKSDMVLFLAANRRLSYIPNVPTLGVVHDLSQLHVKGKYDRFRTFYVLSILPFFMRRLNKIVAVSSATAQDLHQHVGLPIARIAVIFNGAELNKFADAQKKPTSLPSVLRERPYILYTARLEHPGKNHITLIEAFAKLKKNDPRNLMLVLAGSDWNGEDIIKQKIQSLGLENDCLLTGFVANEDLPSLTANASVFAFPSLYEGFGIPLLEAMAAGTPICAANTSSLPEVLGNCGLLFNPTSSTDMSHSLNMLLENSHLCAEFIDRGEKRAAKFSWRTSASKLFNECHRLVLLESSEAK